MLIEFPSYIILAMADGGIDKAFTPFSISPTRLPQADLTILLAEETADAAEVGRLGERSVLLMAIYVLDADLPNGLAVVE